MTTGIDYNTQYINMRPDENTRSIMELIKAERENGYSDMSDIEIANLIEYKEHRAKTDEEMRLLEEKSNAIIESNIEALNKIIENTQEQLEAMHDQEIIFLTVPLED